MFSVKDFVLLMILKPSADGTKTSRNQPQPQISHIIEIMGLAIISGKRMNRDIPLKSALKKYKICLGSFISEMLDTGTLLFLSLRPYSTSGWVRVGDCTLSLPLTTPQWGWVQEARFNCPPQSWRNTDYPARQSSCRVLIVKMLHKNPSLSNSILCAQTGLYRNGKMSCREIIWKVLGFNCNAQRKGMLKSTKPVSPIISSLAYLCFLQWCGGFPVGMSRREIKWFMSLV